MKGAVVSFCFVLLTISLVWLFSFLNKRNSEGKQVSGTVTSIYEANKNDAIIKISGTKSTFCINQVLAKKFNLGDLKNLLIGKKVTILYADHWTPLDPGCTKHVAELAVGEDLVFTELPR